MKTLLQNSKRTSHKLVNDPSVILHDVLARAKSCGATDASVSVSHDTGFSVDLRMGAVETVAFSEEKGVSLTVYIGQKKGSASSSDLSNAALDAMVSAAIEIAKVSASDVCFGLPEKELMSANYADLDLYHPWDITPEKAIEMALQCEQHARRVDKRITNSDGVNISTYAFSNGFANTHGAFGVTDSTRHSMSCSLIAAVDESMQRDYDYTTSRMSEGLVDLEHLANRAAERVVSRLGARQLKTQKMPVLFSSRLSSSLLSSFVGAVSGSNLYRKNSFLLDSLGKRIFPKGFRIYEQPHLLRALGSSACDAEGVLTRNNVIIDDGVLCQYILGCYSARKMGLKTTGNSGGVFNLTIDATAGNLSSLLKQMDKGLLVTELMGNGVNGLTGDYSRGASGFWVEQGQIQYPVEEITIAGNLKDMFLGMVAVGCDINPNSAARCGSILIEEMMVAGE